MDTKVITVDPMSPAREALAEAAELIRSGDVIAFPTETVYGLGANALDALAVAKIFEAKGRPANNPIIVHVLDVEMAKALCAHWPENAERLAEKFWPGPLTLVLPKRTLIPDIVTAGGDTVALRCPAHPVARLLLQLSDVPIAAPSANLSAQLSPTTAKHVAVAMTGRIPLIVDGGAAEQGLESTVVDLTDAVPRILRPGTVSLPQIEAIIGAAAQKHEDHDSMEAGMRSPGMLRKHYSPHTRIECVDAGRALARITELRNTGAKVCWLAFDSTSGLENIDVDVVLMSSKPAEYARNLYAVLHDVDGKGFDRIVVTMPDFSPEWAAVRDRLTRASAI